MTNKNELRGQLLAMINQKAVVREKVTLASGNQSDFYIDGKLVTLDPQGSLLVGQVILSMLEGIRVDAIGGPTLGADPIATAVAVVSAQTPRPIKAFIVRKEAKKHGMQRMIEGPRLKEGDQVVMVEDVITTGGSVLKAIQDVEALKAKVIQVICLVDRNQGARELLAAYNYSPIFNLSDLQI
ncbi:MAG: orotate phosphoribosyltransferase [Candidatus Omnitrophica bacterium]|nr:orotate phosphoribosyltransferase [Candidatus Omnitrophota bacterium]